MFTFRHLLASVAGFLALCCVHHQTHAKHFVDYSSYSDAVQKSHVSPGLELNTDHGLRVVKSATPPPCLPVTNKVSLPILSTVIVGISFLVLLSPSSYRLIRTGLSPPVFLLLTV